MKEALSTVLTVIVLSGIAFSQPTNAEKKCPLAIFDRELRYAINQPDPVTLSLLVSYPLRVNDAEGTYYIKDAASLQGRFEQVFPATVRKAVTTQPVDVEDCQAATVMYGNGEVWVSLLPHGYAIDAVNVANAPLKPPVGRVQFACRTDLYRVVVDIGKDETPRYRAWNTPHMLMQKPDTELSAGRKEVEGTGACTHSVWSFTAGEKITIKELGCFPDSNEPPAGATGQLSISTGQKHDSWWCF
jgi:hypothetical protein